MKKMEILAITIGALILLAAISPALAVTPNLSLSPRIRSIEGTNYSTNWSGYAISGAANSVTSVSGSWTVPAVTASKRTTAYSAFWVGIDGFNSNSVEQIGTDSDVQNGKAVYYAWYEFYPFNAMQRISGLTVTPGDKISASVTYSSGAFTLTITDTTTNAQPYSITESTSTLGYNPAMSSAEWIAEAPSSIGGVLPLANFGTGSSATINGHTGAINDANWQYTSITMATGSGRHLTIEAQPSSLSPDGTSFSVTWRAP